MGTITIILYSHTPHPMQTYQLLKIYSVYVRTCVRTFMYVCVCI